MSYGKFQKIDPELIFSKEPFKEAYLWISLVQWGLIWAGFLSQ